MSQDGMPPLPNVPVDDRPGTVLASNSHAFRHILLLSSFQWTNYVVLYDQEEYSNPKNRQISEFCKKFCTFEEQVSLNYDCERELLQVSRKSFQVIDNGDECGCEWWAMSDIWTPLVPGDPRAMIFYHKIQHSNLHCTSSYSSHSLFRLNTSFIKEYFYSTTTMAYQPGVWVPEYTWLGAVPSNYTLWHQSIIIDRSCAWEYSLLYWLSHL